MIYGSVCSGIEAASVAWNPLGWRAAFLAEIEPFPSAVLAHHYPDVPNLGDMTTINGADWREVDILVGGTPCFPARTMVAASSGLVRIEDVRAGDMVLTHHGRFRPVTAVGSKLAATWRVHGQGHPDMVTTANHPFLARRREARSTRENGRPVRLTWWSERQWVAAEDMAGRHWAMPVKWPSLPVPCVATVGNESVAPVVCPDLLWLAGAYVGDGWTRSDYRRGSLIYGVNENKAAMLLPMLDAVGLRYCATRERTTTRIHVGGRALARWMAGNFGSGAEGKRVPMWLLGAPREWREAFVAGYAATDGTTKGQPDWIALKGLTISRDLALGMRMLGVSLGFAASVGTHLPAPTTVIEGRTVKQRRHWTFTFSTSDRSSVEDDGMRWHLVRKAAPTGETEIVYDITVDEDHSYVADGIVVHNCQSFSIAGLRGSLSDARGSLSLAFVRLAHAIPALRWVVWENVPGVLSTKDNAFGCFLAGLVGADAPLRSPLERGRWPNAGMVSGPRARAAWRVLNAQHFGLAQRRERVFVVAGLGDGTDPAAVLFEPKGVRRNPAPSGKAREETSGYFARSVALRGREGVGTIELGDDIGGCLRASGGGGDKSHVITGTLGGVSPGGGWCVGADEAAAGQLVVCGALSACGVGRMDFETETFVVAVHENQRGEGFDLGERHASSQEADAREILRGVRESLGEEAFAEWGLGILDSFQRSEVLRQALHGSELRPATFSRSWMVYCALSREEDRGAGAVQSMREAASHGCASPGWEPSEQRSRKLGAYLSGLSQPGAQKARFMLDLWQAAEGIGVLRKALSEIQEVGRPACCETKPAQAASSIRRLTPTEAEFLQGFPRNYLDILYSGKPAADGPKYKALGNSMAVPVMRWIGHRINLCETAWQRRVMERLPRSP